VRKFLFTIGPDRLMGGRIIRRHLAQGIVLREVEIWTPAWPEAFDGLRIGHVSDFHLGELMPLDRALEVLDMLAGQEPDLVACTGDVVDLHFDGAGPLLEALGKIDAPLGSALVLGNHDELHCADILSHMAVEAGLVVLRNDAVQFARNGRRLVLAGIEWARTAERCARFVHVAGGEAAHLLLAHNPRAFHAAAACGIPLTLAGHTHGGQLALKNRPAANLAAAHRHTAGVYQRGHSRLYVTSGVGAWFPLRLNCPPEIAILTIRHAPDANGEGPEAA
jgi:hypothetical protein